MIGTNADKRASVPSEMVAVDENHGRLRVMRDTFTTVDDATQVVNVGGLLPQGARIYDARLKVDEAGGTSTAKFGIEGNDDAFLTSHSITNDSIESMSDDFDAEHGLKLDEASQAIVTLTKVDGNMAGLDVEAVVYYVVD